MSVPVDTIMEAKIKYEVNDQVCYNVLHYKITAGNAGPATELAVTQGFLDKISLNVAGGWPFELKKLLSANTFITEVSAQIVFPSRWRAATVATLIGGTDPAICNAQNLTSVVTKRGVFANRHNQGSVHTGGLPTTSYGQGDLTPAAVTALDLYVSGFLSQDVVDVANTVTWTPHILNRQKVVVGGKEKYLINGASPIFQWQAQTTLRTQRTRTKGRGI